jgi:hypothetical protein
MHMYYICIIQYVSLYSREATAAVLCALYVCAAVELGSLSKCSCRMSYSSAAAATSRILCMPNALSMHTTHSYLNVYALLNC